MNDVHKKISYLKELTDRFEARIKGKKGAPARREKFYAALDRIRSTMWPRPADKHPSQKDRKWNWCKKQALYMCSMCDTLHVDEHGVGDFWGDDLRASVLAFISPHHGSKNAPYFDMGGEGLALVRIDRRRTYSKAYTARYGHGHAWTTYLVGKNEAGTYFCHAVNKKLTTLRAAMDWIWDGHSTDIIQRQGDIALICGAGPKIPKNLPSGHVIEGDIIKHATHPDLPMPKKGQRIIVGRRASTTVGQNARD